MPFTLAHPAAVLPLARRPWIPAALVAGAVAPDVPYFADALRIPVSAQSWYEPFLNATTSHGLPGALTVSLPYAALLAAAWWAARRPLDALRTAPARVTAGRPRRTDGLTRAGWVMLSLLAGIATHLLWDSCTHGDGWVVTHVPALSERVTGGLTVARLLQHLSTLAGLAVLGVWAHRRRAALRVRKPAAWTAGAVVALAATAGALVVVTGSDDVSAEHVLRAAAETTGVALGGVAVLYVLVWWATVRLRAAERRV